MGFLEGNVLSTTHDRWIYLRSVRFGPRRSARRSAVNAVTCCERVAPVLCENQSRSNVAEVAGLFCFFMVFFLDKCGRHLLMCWKKWRRKTQKKNKLVDKLMSYTWWFEKKKKLSFVALQTFRMHSENFKINPVSTSPMSCATPIPRKTEM